MQKGQSVQLGDLTLTRDGFFSVLNRLSLGDIAAIRSTCRAAKGAFDKYLEQGLQLTREQAPHFYTLLDQGIVPIHLVIAARQAGVRVDYQKLITLSHICPSLFIELRKLPSRCVWPIAAMSGDANWLLNNLGDRIFEARDNINAGVLSYVLFSGDLPCLKKLQEKAPNFDSAFTDQQNDIVYFSGLNGSEEILNFISVDKDLDIGQPLKRCDEKHNIFYPLIAGGHKETIDTLKSAGMTMLNGSKNLTPLFIVAAENFHFKLCEAISFMMPALHRQTNPQGRTIAHFVAMSDTDKSSVKWLAKSLEELSSKKDNFGKCPADYTRIDSQQYFDGRCASTLDAARTGSWRTFIGMCSGNIENNEKKAVLTFAAQNGQLYFIEKFITKFGRECLNAVDEMNNPITLYLLLSRNAYAVEYMCKKFNLDMLQKNAAGNTPLFQFALQCDKEDWSFIIELAKRFDESLFTTTNSGDKTVIDLATAAGIEVVQLSTASLSK